MATVTKANTISRIITHRLVHGYDGRLWRFRMLVDKIHSQQVWDFNHQGMDFRRGAILVSQKLMRDQSCTEFAKLVILCGPREDVLNVPIGERFSLQLKLILDTVHRDVFEGVDCVCCTKDIEVDIVLVRSGRSECNDFLPIAIQECDEGLDCSVC